MGQLLNQLIAGVQRQRAAEDQRNFLLEQQAQGRQDIAGGLMNLLGPQQVPFQGSPLLGGGNDFIGQSAEFFPGETPPAGLQTTIPGIDPGQANALATLTQRSPGLANMLFGQLFAQPSTPELPIKDIDVSKFTPESIQQFSQTRDFSSLVPRSENATPGFTLSPGQTRFDAQGQRIASGAPRETSPQGVVNVLMPDKTQRAFRKDDPALDLALNQGGVQIGLNVQSPSVGELTGKSKGALEEKIIDMNEAISRIQDIKKRFQPKFQRFRTKLDMAILNQRDKLGFNISPKEKANAKEFFSFKRRAIENINLDIKRLTGVQMSEPEANRIRQGMPDPGEGIFSGDGPTEFQTKLDDTLASLKAADARFKFLRSQGIQEVTPEIAEQYPLEHFTAPALSKPLSLEILNIEDLRGLSNEELEGLLK